MVNDPSSQPAPPLNPSPAHLGLAVASLVLGILALISSWIVIGAVLGLAGLILGVAHILRRQSRNGMAWAGIVLSVFGLTFSVGAAAAYFHAGKSISDLLGARPPGADSTDFDQWKGVLAPGLTVTNLDGAVFRLSDLRGKRVVLDFWATWCPPCVAEIPHFIQLRRETSPDELVMLGISNEDPETLKAFVKRKGMNYPVASAEKLPSPYDDVTAIPTTFFIDRKGVIQAVFVGYHDFAELKANALAKDYEGPPKTAPGATAANAP
jgi:peroxiredoxin